ncbi:MAG: putative TrmH family tRNA/rRNA methyltransferase [Chlamydiae bacterium]|nr:putative TrmH family tRNA/rRNA methyltransferase [Chlamydiota bacterium]
MLSKEISSPQHPIVKTFVKLRTSRKFRYEQKQVVIAGIKQVSEAPSLDILLVRTGFSHSLKANQIYSVSESLLKKVTGLESPEPMAAIVGMPDWASLNGKKWILGLDGIQDPGNLGTLLRTALALGWEGAFMTENCVDPFNEKALRAAKGATFRLPLRMDTEKKLCLFAKDYQTWIADPHGKSLNEISSQKNGFLILGNEAQGVSETLKAQFNALSIPIADIESLNVAAAGAILMYNLKS